MCYWKTKKKIICRHFLIDGTCKKGTGSQNTYCHLWKVMGQIVNLVVALLSILVPCDWKWLYFFAFYPWTWPLLSGVTVVPVKESACHTLFSKSVLGIDWAVGLIYMVSLKTYWALFRALCSKLVIRFSSRELQFFEINSSEFSLPYLLIKSSNRLFRPLSLSVISENFNNFSMVWVLLTAVQIARIWIWNQNIWQKVTFS